jgi:hypothetical protein
MKEKRSLPLNVFARGKSDIIRLGLGPYRHRYFFSGWDLHNIRN